MNELKLQWMKWSLKTCIKLRKFTLNKAQEHLRDDDETKFNKWMDRASFFTKHIVRLTKEAEEIIEREELKAMFWN